LVPIHRIGQGNGAGPAIQAVVSTPLLNVLCSKGFGCEFVMPQPNVFAHFVGYAFVDDINIIQSSLKNDYLEALAWLQQTIDTWENNLKATYSAIVPDKTVWWLFSFKWQGNHWQYMSIQDAPGELYIIDVNGV
jgi:hypothetical protein